MSFRIFIIFFAVIFPHHLVFAKGFSGQGEAGIVSSRGNTDTDSINVSLSIGHEGETWRKSGDVNALLKTENGEDTARRFDTGLQADYLLSEKNYIFSAARYEDDAFSGFAYQVTVSTGYGRRLLNREDLFLDGEIGVGYREIKSKESDSGEGDVILRSQFDYSQKFGGVTTLSENILMETGSDNTFVESKTGVAVAMNAKLAMKLGFHVRHNTDPPEDNKKTDTLTTVSLVYGF